MIEKDKGEITMNFEKLIVESNTIRVNIKDMSKEEIDIARDPFYARKHKYCRGRSFKIDDSIPEEMKSHLSVQIIREYEKSIIPEMTAYIFHLIMDTTKIYKMNSVPKVEQKTEKTY